MKFTVQGKEFLTQLNASAKVLNSKNTISMLDNFLLRLEGNRLFITSSDSENVLTSFIEVFDAEGEGCVAMPAKRLIEIIKEVSGQPITFDVHEDFSVDVSYLNGEFSFMGVDPKPFPLPAPLGAEAKTMKVPAEVVAAGLTATLFAVATDTVRPIMTGICWDFFPDKLVFVSSDTHKLVRYTNTTFAPGEELTFVLHSKTASVVNSLLGDDTELVEITIDDQSAIFNFGAYTLNCRFLKGKFPNYNRVIPTDNPYQIVVDRQSLLAAVKRVSIFASKAAHLVRFGISEGQIALATQDLDYSVKANEVVTCDYDGGSLTIGFRADFMQEVLTNIPSESIVIKVSDPARPSLFVPFEQKEGEDLVILQMPVQVIE